MINEFSVHPKPRNKNAKIAFLIAILVSAGGFVAYSLMPRYRGVVGTFALFVLVTAILFYTKFIAPAFHYDITVAADGTPLFVVRQVTGKRATTLCRIELANITAVEYETRAARKAHKTEKGTRVYVYAPTMFPPDVYRIISKSRYETSEIIIEANEEFAGLLRDYSEEARLMQSDEE